VGVCLCGLFIYFFIDIQRAALQSNATYFRVKHLQYIYIYLHVCTISSMFYSYGRFTVGTLI